jgi:hypothetical protein
MSILSDYVSRMVECGMDQDEAMQVAAELFAAGVASASNRPTPGALRTRKWRHKTSQGVTGDTVNKADESVTKRHETSQSVTSDKVPLSTSSSLKRRERQNRGTRITADWSPTDAERSFAKQQGFSEFEVHREVDKFRDYWTACAGAKGVKLDWSATWRQWIRNGAERAGKAPPHSRPDPEATGYYAKGDSAQLAAWDAHAFELRGKYLPRDKNGGWRVAAEWPPGYVPPESKCEVVSIPSLKRMQ